MDQDRIAAIIKKVRKDNNLTQEKFADSLNVTYQAVSKWENGKSIPDISTLQLISKKYNVDINDLLDTNITSKNNKNYLFLAIISIAVVISLGIIAFVILNSKNTFETKNLNSTCNDFNIYGTISYDKSKTHIYISDIDYCGKEDSTVYNKIESVLYSIGNNTETVMAKGETINNIVLKNYVDELKFNTSSNTCNIIKGNQLKLVIKAYTEDNKYTTFEIPLKLGDFNC